jgi:hypothetical protein
MLAEHGVEMSEIRFRFGSFVVQAVTRCSLL